MNSPNFLNSSPKSQERLISSKLSFPSILKVVHTRLRSWVYSLYHLIYLQSWSLKVIRFTLISLCFQNSLNKKKGNYQAKKRWYHWVISGLYPWLARVRTPRGTTFCATNLLGRFRGEFMGRSIGSVHRRGGLVGARMDPDTPGMCVFVWYLLFKEKRGLVQRPPKSLHLRHTIHHHYHWLFNGNTSKSPINN